LTVAPITFGCAAIRPSPEASAVQERGAVHLRGNWVRSAKTENGFVFAKIALQSANPTGAPPPS